jgi:NAD(P)-dependent dehydrogenase (short-subunit alcohol dehydrogenase family)
MSSILCGQESAPRSGVFNGASERDRLFSSIWGVTGAGINHFVGQLRAHDPGNRHASHRVAGDPPDAAAEGMGRIVNITSLVILGMVNRTAYAASNAALGSFTRTWALELAETGITVNSVAPGPVETELFRRNTPPGSEAERIFLTNIPMRRLAHPEEIAAAVAFMLSEDASYITGQTLFVDGGGSIGKAAI